MPRLTKRSSVTIPPPLPQRGSEEATETTLCTVEEKPLEKSEPIMGWCINGCKMAAFSWVTKMCYKCHRLETRGEVWDDDEKKWIKVPERRKK